MTIINPRPLYRERLRWISASAVALAFGPALRARAQSATYPTRPMRLVVPFPPGGSPDVQARMLAQKLSVRWGQPVVVENKAGASGNIGAEQVVKSPPDGHTLLMVVSNMLTSNPVLTRTPFDPLKDFTPVGVTAQVQFMLVCHPAVPAATAAEFIRHVRAQPGRLNYGSSGDGSTQHLATLLLSDLAGLSMTHIPYKGAAPAVTDLLSGQIQVWIGAANSLMPYVKDKRLRALAVTGRDRWSGAPELPTLAESGVPGYAYGVWLGLAGPAGMQASVVAQLRSDVAAILQEPAIVEALREQGIDASLSTAAQMTERIRSEGETWARVLKPDPARAIAR